MAPNVGRNPFDAKTDELVTQILKELHVPGAALAVVDGEKTWSKGYGIADVDSQSIVTPKTLFSCASVTKPFTAAAAAVLIEDEKHNITWESPMCKLIPDDFVLVDDYATKYITLEDCLSHRTGIATHHADLGGHSLRQNVKNLRHLDITRELRTKWQYSNHMYLAVSLMIEEKTGQPLGEFMRDRLWHPLGMETTFLGVQDALAYQESHPEAELAGRHMWDEEANSFKTLPVWDDLGLSGAGAMVSSVADCAEWIRALVEQKAPISSKGYEALTSAHMILKPKSPRFTGPVCYGLGWYVAVYRGERVLYHPGGLIGSVASLIILPDRKLGVAGMCNITNEEALDAAMWHIIDEHLEVPKDARTDFIEEAKQGLQGMKYFAENSKAIMFPPETLHEPAVPPSVSITRLLGSYTHPSYGTIVLEECDGQATIHGVYPGRLPLDPLILQHIDGDVFLARADLVHMIPVRARATFKTDAAGDQLNLGVDFEQGLTTWFVRDRDV
ncbi:Protein flp [Cytospora mali]|uniref:Protein flp n=1 Tax=Cytospora mali TaxID=578113 RepID=A0A194W193_CYTMA|nr:Protein flp [Valsa mali]